MPLTISTRLCVVAQNGNLRQKIAGADTPLLSSHILQLTPISADTDDLAVRKAEIKVHVATQVATVFCNLWPRRCCDVSMTAECSCMSPTKNVRMCVTGKQYGESQSSTLEGSSSVSQLGG